VKYPMRVWYCRPIWRPHGIAHIVHIVGYYLDDEWVPVYELLPEYGYTLAEDLNAYESALAECSATEGTGA
jgi:hypothetical protein